MDVTLDEHSESSSRSTSKLLYLPRNKAHRIGLPHSAHRGTYCRYEEMVSINLQVLLQRRQQVVLLSTLILRRSHNGVCRSLTRESPRSRSSPDHISSVRHDEHVMSTPNTHVLMSIRYVRAILHNTINPTIAFVSPSIKNRVTSVNVNQPCLRPPSIQPVQKSTTRRSNV